MSPIASNHHPAPRRLLAAMLATLAMIAIAATGLTTQTLAAECPNEALRAENNSTRLPECRAYELVNQPFKEGFASVLHAYTDDGVFAYRSSGNFADNGMGTPGNEYVATRSATGWHTTAPAPSGPTYLSTSGSVDTFSADLRSTVWEMRRPDQATNVGELYLRGLDETFTLIGPGAAPETLSPGVPGTTYNGPVIPSVTASADLSHVLFTLFSQNGYPGDTSQGTSTLYEYVGTGNDRPQLVGVDNAGHQLSGTGTCPNDMSPDGRVVFFTPSCSGGGTPQVWARINETMSIDASASECTRSSADPGGVCNGLAGAEFAGVARDGSRVYFTTTQQLVNDDTDQTNDLYACDIPPGTPAPVGTANPCSSLTELSGSATGAEVENVVNVSEDGSRVYFVAKGVLASNLGTNDAPAVAGDNNLYVSQLDAAHQSGQTAFVAKLDSDDVGSLPLKPTDMVRPQSTADGRYLVFTTANKLLPSDTDEAQDVYRYDADTGTLLRLSTDSSGTGGNEPGFDASTNSFPSLPERPRTIMTSDGGTVVLLTGEALSPSDTNGQPDVYAWHEGQVSLISSGRPYLENPATPWAWISASGTDIYFNTTAQLTPNDGDTNPDIYDARVGGGFFFAASQSCSGEACLTALAPAPQAPATPASAALSGVGNLTTSVTTPVSKPAPKSLTRTQKLAKALKACKSKHNKRKRSACERKARATYRKGK